MSVHNVFKLIPTNCTSMPLELPCHSGFLFHQSTICLLVSAYLDHSQKSKCEINRNWLVEDENGIVLERTIGLLKNPFYFRFTNKRLMEFQRHANTSLVAG